MTGPPGVRRGVVRVPTAEDLERARGARIPDVLAPGLSVVFCGINPSLYSAAVGHHFARPGNRFWATLHGAGFTDRIVAPFEDRSLLTLGYGVTNLVDRATARADEIPDDELQAAARTLRAKLKRYAPRHLAVLGIGAFRAAFGRSRAAWGPQPEPLGATRVWVLPNPSGLNASFQLPALVRAYRELRRALDA
jgi:TDG/mug DNA glycosylase family protein